MFGEVEAGMVFGVLHDPLGQWQGWGSESVCGGGGHPAFAVLALQATQLVVCQCPVV